MSREEIDLSSEELVRYIIETKSTIRETANHFGVSKSLVWSRLKRYNGSLRNQLDETINNNTYSTRKNLKYNKG